MTSPSLDIEGRDIDISLLKPLQERQINLEKHAGFKKIVASIKSIGLIEPLCVYQEDGVYNILDGYLRFKACIQLQIETIPCLLYKTRKAYSYNKQVNRLSSYQEMKMLRKAAESIPEPEIAGTLGLKTIRYRLSPTLIKQLHSKVAEAFKNDLITKPVATELTYVLPERQTEILDAMAEIGDYSLAFCRSLIIKSPTKSKNTKKKYTPKSWHEDDAKRKDMVARLSKAEKQHDFYASLYRQYSTDLMKMIFHVRKIITNPKVLSHMQKHHAELLARMREVIFEAENGQEA